LDPVQTNHSEARLAGHPAAAAGVPADTKASGDSNHVVLQHPAAAQRELADHGFVASAPPLALSSFVASLLEPAVAIATLMALTLAYGNEVDTATRLLGALALLLLFPGQDRFFDKPASAARGIVLAWATAAGVLLLCGYATNTIKAFDSEVLIAWAVCTPLAQIACTWLGSAVLRQRSRVHEDEHRALVIGAGALGAKVAELVTSRAAYGHRCVGYVEDRMPARCHANARDKLLGRFDDVLDLIERHHIREVYLTLPLSLQPRISRLLTELRDAAVTIYFVPDLFAFSVIQGRMRNLQGIPMVSLLESPFVGVNALVKRASDIVLGSLILVLIAPVLLAVAIAVKLSSPGPVIFKQRRNGLDGQEIVVWKFRSMTVTENGNTITQARRNDPRITRVGAFIRRTSLDELPQFFNVLQGSMSIVGPRPHAVAHNEQYRNLIRAYMIRHKVKPGITGLAQVSGFRGETDVIEKMAGRVEYDIEYLRRWSLWLDLKIIARTVAMTLFDRNAY
jgi:putative colanic acid biosynthesis UDP-glucose lipid carrier transferase